MSKRNKILYWVATIWLALGMVSTGIVQIIQLEEETIKMKALGYPMYILTLIGVWKILGSLAILLPKLPFLKEWAYAGFFFVMSGAIFSHFVVGDSATEFFGPTLLLLLTVASWYLRPNDKKFTLPNS